MSNATYDERVRLEAENKLLKVQAENRRLKHEAQIDTMAEESLHAVIEFFRGNAVIEIVPKTEGNTLIDGFGIRLQVPPKPAEPSDAE